MHFIDLAWPHQLRRKFRLVVFDWDGTAVADRDQPAPRLAAALEALLQQGVTIGIVAGTKLEHILNKCVHYIRKEIRENLFVFTNRGSEVWSFGNSGEPLLLSRYEASTAELDALDRVATAAVEFLNSKGMRAEVISARLNRRKIDLIPLPEWADPRKSQARELSIAVKDRLEKAGIAGIAEVMEHVREESFARGLQDARITSDLKHVEIGLTDKSHSMMWIVENIGRARSIRVEDVAVFGDEFGYAGGVKGSDSLMMIPELEDAVFGTVGLEPGGVPDGVLNMGGGPDRFARYLLYLGALWAHGRSLFEGLHIPTANPSWLLEQEGFDPSREREMESLFSFGNGYLGVRGYSNLAIPGSQAELYVSGIYDHKAAALPYSELQLAAAEERPNSYAEIVAFPPPFSVQIQVGRLKLVPGASEMRAHERILDMKKGLLFELFYFDDLEGREIVVRSLRLTSVADPHLLMHELEIRHDGRLVAIELDFFPEVRDFALRYPHLKHLPVVSRRDGFDQRNFGTAASGFTASYALKRIVNGNEERERVVRAEVSSDHSILVRAIGAVFTNRDGSSPERAAREHLEAKSWNAFDQEVFSHAKRWKGFWNGADLRLIENPSMTQASRFNLYHLRSAAPVSDRSSVGAKGLTGRSYEGHIFWDAEIYVLPFYFLNLPEAGRNSLMYRYHTLNGARERARGMGYRGACFAWESTVDGVDVTPKVITLLESKQRVPIYTGEQQIHVTADIAYAIMQYWDFTRDDAFMRDYGAEILAETARFWVSRATEKNGRLHLLNVIGPDEYHFNVNDNAFTNWMARLNLHSAVRVVNWLEEHYPDRARELRQRLEFAPGEPDAWNRAADSLFVPEPNRDGVIEQFEGFFQLADVKLRPDERGHAPVERLLRYDEVNRSKLLKQADVLMLPFLFPDAFPKEIVSKNFDYYEPLTDHASSLSKSVHAAVAARIGRADLARRYWEESVNFDLQDLMGNTSLGIHMACIGGAWQALVFHFLGLRWRDGKLVRNPSFTQLLPTGVQEIVWGAPGVRVASRPRPGRPQSPIEEVA